MNFNVKELMLHKPPMLLVDCIIEENGDKAKTSFSVKEDCIFLDENMRLARSVFVELAAQSFAAVDAYQKTKAKGEKSKGFLVGVRDFHIYGDAHVGDELICSLEKADKVERLNICKSEIFKGELKIAQGELRIFEIPV